MSDVMRFLNKTAKFLNKLSREIERDRIRAEKADIRRQKEEIKAQKARTKLIENTRKTQATEYGYIFDKDIVSRHNNRLRIQGLLKDYIFWQYFAIEEVDDIDIDENLKKQFEAIHPRGDWKAEWRVE